MAELTKKQQQLLADIKDAANRAKSGGFSKSFVGAPDPTKGHVVSRKGAEVTLDHPPTETDIANYVAQHGKHLKNKDHYLGYWPVGDGRHVLDVSRVIQDEDEAHDFGRKNKQEALFNLNNGQVEPIRKFKPEEEQFIQQLHDNIVHSYNKTSELDRHAGAVWYEEEAAKIRDWAKRHDVDDDKAIQAFAAMSPGQDWDQIHAVMSALHTHGPLVTTAQAGYGVPVGYGRDNFMKAHRILKEGASLDDVMRSDAPKVRAFYSNLANASTDADNVTIDGHAHNISLNDFQRVGITDAPQMGLKRYRLIEEAYKRAAATVGAKLPHHVQAATWIGYRRLDPKAAKMRADPLEDADQQQQPDELAGLGDAWEPGRE